MWPADFKEMVMIGITCFLCINTFCVQQKLFEHEAARSSIQTSPGEPGKNFSEKLILKKTSADGKKV